MKNRLLTGILVLVLALFSASLASAQEDASPSGQEASSPSAQESSSAGVARISLLHGDVSTQRGDSGDWAAAALNAPIVGGDKVSTGENSRAEVQLDNANVLRLGDRSQATIAGLTRSQIQIQLGQGIANYSILRGSEANVEIDTANVAIRPGQQDGSFRIEVNATGETEVIVRRGEAEISTPQGSTRIEKGQLATIRGTGDDTQYKVSDAPSKDSWDSWNSERDHMIQNANSWQHTNRYYVGSEDLDAYGHWVTVPDYGPVWSPVVSVGWAPYRAGRWVYEPYWGWTWVSYEPWGWAPYHYGRWFMYGSSWVWWPGAVGGFYRPVWAPAYVSFFGFGGGVGFGVGFGSVGWLPIGPCDRFYPWYGRGGSRVNIVNVTNITNITNIRNANGGIAPLRGGNQYSNLRMVATNERFRSAISTVPANHFGTGRVAATPVTQQMFRNGKVMTGNLPIVPSRENLSASNRAANPSTIRSGGQNFFSKSRPMAAPQSFDKQAAQVQNTIQHSGFTPIRSASTPVGLAKPGAMTINNATNGMRGTTLAKPSAGTATQTTTIDRGATSRVAASPTPNRGNVPATGGATNSVGSVDRTPANNGWRTFGSGGAQNGSSQNPSIGRNNSSVVPRPPQVQNARPLNSTSGSSDGWRRFSDSNPSRGQSQPMNGRTFGSPNSTNPPNGVNSVPRPPQSSTPGNNGGFQRFPSSSGAGQYSNRGGQVNDQWNRFPSRTQSSPTMQTAPQPRYYGTGRGGSRPQLDMRQPIVSPRGSSGTPSFHGSPAPSVHGGSAPKSGGGGGSSHSSSGHSGGHSR